MPGPEFGYSLGMTNTNNRAKEIYEAAVSYSAKGDQMAARWNAVDIIWLAQCTDEERRDALRMLDDRFAAVST